MRFARTALWGIVAVSAVATCALLVYLGALLLAHLVLWIG